MELEIPDRFFARLTDNPLALAFERPGPDLALERGASQAVSDDGVLEPLLMGQCLPQAAYISLPFCTSFCTYCGFGKVGHRPELEERYVEALLAEIAQEASKPAVRQAQLKAVYFGGGTPTALKAANISKVLGAVSHYFQLAPDAEITFEGRLSTLDPEKELAVREGGTTRFSFGIQSFDPQVRRRAGRRDSPEKIIQELKRLKEKSPAQIVIDLMYGLPGQTLEIFLNDLHKAANLGLEDLSVYQLKLMARAPLKRLIEQGRQPPLPSMIEIAKFHLLAVEELTKLGYRQISAHHYSQRGRDKNVYNKLSLSRSDLLAYGLGAGGRLGGAAFGNTLELDQYFRAVDSGRKPLARFRPASRHQSLLDLVSLMALEGVFDRSRIHKAQSQLWRLIEPLITQWTQAGLINEAMGDLYQLTAAGLFWRGTIEAYLRQWLEMKLA
jgi:oxygen-independent coproporphyrinogen-3 oxidase